MNQSISKKIVAGIINGKGVAESYADAAKQISADIDLSLIKGLPFSEAATSAGLDLPHNQTAWLSGGSREDRPHIMMIILSGGGVSHVPSAACVAEQLKDKPQPHSRDDIETAFKVCSK